MVVLLYFGAILLALLIGSVNPGLGAWVFLALITAAFLVELDEICARIRRVRELLEKQFEFDVRRREMEEYRFRREFPEFDAEMSARAEAEQRAAQKLAAEKEWAQSEARAAAEAERKRAAEPKPLGKPVVPDVPAGFRVARESDVDFSAIEEVTAERRRTPKPTNKRKSGA